ncbi:hypothetical protein LOZ65_004348 [Ophidiomyces ophidiicola]|nr:hypothetical protein LOZ65_004348 [Ophidiomyces ophidiicola]
MAIILLDTWLNGVDWNANDSFFDYTRGRFVVDEAEQMKQRHVRFDMNELARIAAKSVGARHCTNVEKCADGLYNKAFVFTMDDGKQVIGKIPNPNAGTPHFTTASEMRTVLQTPTPQVYAWNSRLGDSNTVGAEFIVKEKIQGIPLAQCWRSLQQIDKLKVLIKVFDYQRAWSSITFTKFGSLYFVNDVENPPAKYLYIDKEGNSVQCPKFIVGQASNYEWFENGRNRINCDQGPWDTVLEYRKAIGRREAQATKTLTDFPRQMLASYGPAPLYQPLPERKLAAIESYMKTLETFLPRDPVLLKSHLWHNDFHDENIFVNPENPTEITGIIDWQSAHIAPLFDHVLDPLFLDYQGPDIGDNLDKPQLPDNFKSMQGEEKIAARNLFLDKGLTVAWRRLVKKKNPNQYSGIMFRNSAIGVLLEVSRRIFEVGEANFRALLLDIRNDWQNQQSGASASSVPFPLDMSEGEVAEIEKDAEAVERGMEIMMNIRGRLGGLWPEKGVVEHDKYDQVKIILQDIKKELMEIYAETAEDKAIFEKYWPFRD